MTFRNLTFPALATLLVLAAFAGPQSARAHSAQEVPKTPQRPAGGTIEPVDINRAAAEDLAKLPGIGPELARRIVAFREKHGPFRRVEDLLAIRGVGHKKWRAIRPYLRIGNEAEKKKTMNDE